MLGDSASWFGVFRHALTDDDERRVLLATLGPDGPLTQATAEAAVDFVLATDAPRAALQLVQPFGTADTPYLLDLVDHAQAEAKARRKPLRVIVDADGWDDDAVAPLASRSVEVQAVRRAEDLDSARWHAALARLQAVQAAGGTARLLLQVGPRDVDHAEAAYRAAAADKFGDVVLELLPEGWSDSDAERLGQALFALADLPEAAREGLLGRQVPQRSGFTADLLIDAAGRVGRCDAYGPDGLAPEGRLGRLDELTNPDRHWLELGDAAHLTGLPPRGRPQATPRRRPERPRPLRALAPRSSRHQGHIGAPRQRTDVTDLLHRLHDTWAREGLLHPTQATPAEVDAVEARFGVAFPPILRRFYTEINGSVNGKWSHRDPDLALWPVHQLELHEDSDDAVLRDGTALVFADHALRTWIYVLFFPKSGGPPQIRHPSESRALEEEEPWHGLPWPDQFLAFLEDAEVQDRRGWQDVQGLEPEAGGGRRPVTPPPDADPPFRDSRVAACFAAHPAPVRARLLELRALLHDVAEELDVGPVEETLRWGEPTYLAPRGTMVRLDCKDPTSAQCQLLVHCQTDLVATFRTRHPGTLPTQGTRALLLDTHAPLPTAALRDFLGLALTYKLRKRRRG